MKNSEQPAFPISDEVWNNCGEKPSPFGLTKREYFAAMAMQGLLSNFLEQGHYGNSTSFPMVGEIAVSCADELLKELEK